MSLRLRMIFSAAAAVAVAIVLAAAGAYFTTRAELLHQVDATMARRIDASNRIALGGPVVIQGGDAAANPFRGRNRFANGAATVQVIDADGSVVFGNGVALPIGPVEVAKAEGLPGIAWRDVWVAGSHLRMATAAVAPGLAIQITQPLDAIDATLHRLVLLLALLVLGGIALAATLGWVVARAALAPVERLTAEAERVAAATDLSAKIEVHGVDEIARLAGSLNSMLAAVDESQREQRQLIADASHELRTPLTSLRTNLEVLARSAPMDDTERQALLSDVLAQIEELGTLVGQLVALDRGPIAEPEAPPAPVALDEVVERALNRARRNAPGLVFDAQVEPTTVMGYSGMLERAVANLLDNAAKWSPPGGTVEVRAANGVVTVRDHGPGIDPADVPHVFDRFYRSVAARGLPGSGLGLSIVRQAAEEHGGGAWVENASGGGTLAGLAIAEPAEPEPPSGVSEPEPPNQALGPELHPYGD